MNAVTVILGIVILLVGVVSLIRPDLPIDFRNEWARLISRPFMPGRVLGEARTDDPLQRLHSRLGGTLAIIVGIGFLVVGLLANNG